ncbi:MAG: efflux RND transporter periplasmic adaptor subunit [Desulfobacterales bacterium]|nr:efflux RND transporter periplasmic adaptor subunit [Desulfobacterales bacterium]MCP4162033.1 efflux RND transporter periplasmic adaptor subunit [Deltaproteobacteria bacterium]
MNFIKKHIKSKISVFLIISVTSLIFISLTLTNNTKTVDKNKGNEKDKVVLPITVINAKSSDYPAIITLLGEVQPVKESFLKSQVSGKVNYVSENLKRGVIVKKGELLISIENSLYRSRVAQYELQLASAKLSLLKEKKEANEAVKNWENSGLKGKADPLLLRKPQLLVAEKEVSSAKAVLLSAEKEFSHCNIRAPFDGLIVKNSVNSGDSISEGQEIFLIYGIKKAEIAVNLNSKQWSKLPTDLRSINSKIIDDQQNMWDAKIVREGMRIVPESRLRELFLEVKNPLNQNPPLLFGAFLSVKLTGKNISDLLELPESALTKSGKIWYVVDNLLSSYNAKPVFYQKGKVFVHPPKDMKNVSIAISPNSSFINGLRVLPTVKGGKS